MLQERVKDRMSKVTENYEQQYLRIDSNRKEKTSRNYHMYIRQGNLLYEPPEFATS